jgi:hypothetical protein
MRIILRLAQAFDGVVAHSRLVETRSRLLEAIWHIDRIPSSLFARWTLRVGRERLPSDPLDLFGRL